MHNESILAECNTQHGKKETQHTHLYRQNKYLHDVDGNSKHKWQYMLKLNTAQHQHETHSVYANQTIIVNSKAKSSI